MPSKPHATEAPPDRSIFCNRTLNLQKVRAIGYDMDYTLIHYRVDAWERTSFEHLKQKLLARGWPVEQTAFDPEMITRGLAFDLERGNIVKANRFGFVIRAAHGTRMIAHEDQRAIYAQVLVDLASGGFVAADTLFSISEGCMYAQLVDLLDAHRIEGVLGYPDLYRQMKRALDETHMEGELKAEIIADPDRFVELDPEMPLALLDQRQARKKLLLITNSGWHYTKEMMRYAFDRFLPGPMTWRDLFDVVIVSARKPEFFSGRSPLFEVVDDDGLLRPVIGGLSDGIYLGGNASQVEEALGLAGDQILYVGDHVYGDVHVSKRVLQWRTALVLRELEDEIQAMHGFAGEQSALRALMQEKEALEAEACQLRLELQRREHGDSDRTDKATDKQLRSRLDALRSSVLALDQRVQPLARASGELSNKRWGLLMRAGNDKSRMARQVERYADIYLSRVSNFLHATPFVYLRAPRGSLPNDPLPFSTEV